MMIQFDRKHSCLLLIHENYLKFISCMRFGFPLNPVGVLSNEAFNYYVKNIMSLCHRIFIDFVPPFLELNYCAFFKPKECMFNYLPVEFNCKFLCV